PWSELDGYPVGAAQGLFKFHATGTGLRIHYRKDTDGGIFVVYLNNKMIAEVDTAGEERERAVYTVDEQLPAGPLNIQVLVKKDVVFFEGIQLLGRPALHGPKGWLSILPDGGVTTREIDYVMVTVNTKNMAPAVYREVVEFASNGGNHLLEVFVEVTSSGLSRWIDVFRYTNGRDYLYTSNPQADEGRITAGNYRKEGIAFRLFPPATPGTQEFLRWYAWDTGRHFYTYDKTEAARALPGSRLDGPLGNIATTRLPQTKELYRWRHERWGHYFYTTEAGGGGLEKKGYRFEGIVGYVH
ncbi:MAG: hypothetical protein N2509_09105, partial [Treponemataceae bacterium]|nr:hypothetical protein [Treponemataceae bacterium]